MTMTHPHDVDAMYSVTHRQYPQDERCVLEVVLQAEVDLPHVL
jgi:hypothetical protein